MSSYYDYAVNPDTGNAELALFMDDYYGPHKYGVCFQGLKTYPEEDVKRVFIIPIDDSLLDLGAEIADNIMKGKLAEGPDRLKTLKQGLQAALIGMHLGAK